MLYALPPAGSSRWYKRHKAEVVAAVHGGLLTFTEAAKRYQMMVEELFAWQSAYEKVLGISYSHAPRPYNFAATPKADTAGYRTVGHVAKAHNPDERIGQTMAVPSQPIELNSPGIVTSGSLAVNLNSRTVVVHDLPIQLTRPEYRILELLCLRKGMTVTKAMLLKQISSGAMAPKPRIIDVYICKLRRKLAAAGNGENYIGTIWGRGYTLDDPKSQKPNE